jgi:hypothetical protein
LLEDSAREGNESIVSFQPHGKAFRIHKPKEFAGAVLPRYFGETKYRSFQRQLAIYGFERIKDKNCVDNGAYFHELFIKGKHNLCLHMTRQKVKGTKYHAIQNGGAHLNFSANEKSAESCFEPVPLTPEELDCVRSNKNGFELPANIVKMLVMS